MVQGLIRKQHSVFNENGTGSQDEGGEQVDVDVVSGAAELSERCKITQKNKYIKNLAALAIGLSVPVGSNFWFCQISFEF